MAETPVTEITRKADLAAIKEHPSWADLREFYKDRREKDAAAMGRALLAGTPLDQRAVDMKRGFWAGVKAVLDTPEAAEKALEAELQRVQAEEEQRESDRA